MNRVVIFFSSLLLAGLLHGEETAPPPRLKVAITLPGVEGRFDHAALDPATHRLFFAALGNNTLEVLDVVAGKRLHTITGLSKPTGVLFLSDFNLLAVANSEDGTCRFYDGTSYKEQSRLAGLDDADNLRFDAKAKRIYLGYGDGALGVIDPAMRKFIGTIPLAKHPEAFQLEQDGPRIFVNIPDAKQIAVVDRVEGKVVATWPMGNLRGNFPMALDEGEHRLFAGCRQPARLVAIDTALGKIIAETPMSGDVDDLFFDASTNRLFASCGAGFIDVFRSVPPASPVRTTQLATAPGARTAFYSAELKAFYLAVPSRGAQNAEIRIYDLNPSE